MFLVPEGHFDHVNVDQVEALPPSPGTTPNNQKRFPIIYYLSWGGLGTHHILTSRMTGADSSRQNSGQQSLRV